jgi:hypothetical protein
MKLAGIDGTAPAKKQLSTNTDPAVNLLPLRFVLKK